MKIYFHIDTETFSNSYLVVNEASKEALIVDPCKITNVILNQIESVPYELKAVLFTNAQAQKTHALSTLLKIYQPNIYAADFSVSKKRDMLTGSGIVDECGFKIEYSTFQWHSFDAVIYKLANMIFTGEVLSASLIGETSSAYAKQNLIYNIKSSILTQNEIYTILPGNGPPTSVKAEKEFNAIIQ